jgi:hypothetical protein
MLGLKKAPAGALILLVLVVTRGASGETYDEPFQESVIYCEEAVARLGSCCPTFDGTPVVCSFRHSGEGGCGEGWRDNEDPALSLAESRCILDMSCEDMRSKGVCSRAQKARPYLTKKRYVDGGDIDTGSRSHPPVCP